MNEMTLKEFFYGFGIKYFVTGNIKGEFGVDWWFIPKDNLDSVVYEMKFNAELELWHIATSDSKLAINLDSDGREGQRFNEKIQHPYLSLREMRYTFLSVKLREGEFYIRTLFEKGSVKKEELNRLHDLKNMIGILPPRNLLEKLRRGVAYLLGL